MLVRARRGHNGGLGNDCQVLFYFTGAYFQGRLYIREQDTTPDSAYYRDRSYFQENVAYWLSAGKELMTYT